MDEAAVCEQEHPYFTAGIVSTRGDLLVYLHLMKQETTRDLPFAQAAIVLKTAADAARIIALQRIKAVAGSETESGHFAVRLWCRRTAAPEMIAFIHRQDVEYASILKDIQGAKR